MRVSVGDVELFFDVDGPQLVPDGPAMLERPTVIALHGGPGADHATLRPELSGLSDVAQVVFLDQRGHGRSDRSTEDCWNMATWADDVRRFCDALSIDKPIVFGVSFGGEVALHYALRHPDHPAKLILDSIEVDRNVERSVTVFERLGGPDAAQAARRWLTSPSPESGAEYAKRCQPLRLRQATPASMADVGARSIHNRAVTIHWATHRNADTLDLALLDRVKCPTLILSGEDDPVTPVEGTAELANRLGPNVATLKRFPDTGHAVFRERSTEALAAIKSFMLS